MAVESKFLAASKMSGNTELRARVEMAIRKVAEAKQAFDGPSGQLAAAGYTAPETVAHSFMLRLSVNADAVDKTCAACGHSTVDDSALEWVVDNQWDAVAAALYPSN